MKIYDITGIGANLTGSFSGSFKEIFTGTATTASYVQYSNVADKPTLISGSSQIADFGYATTGSNQFDGSQAITGSLTVTGQVVAQTLNVQQVTSSIVYSSGSNIFGNSLTNTQQFTGSLQVSGSSHYVLGNVGIGTTGLSEKLTVDGNILLGGDYNLAIDVTTNGNGKVGRTDRAYLQINRSNFEGFLSFHTTLTGADGLSERMRITSGGNVGIGMSAPTTRLDIGNGTLTLPTLRGRTYQLSNVSSANPNFITGTGFNSIPVRVGDIIDLPFGQTRTVTAVTDTVLTVDAAWTVSFAGSNVDGRGGIVFEANNAERMRITSGGNVGIGTTDPQSLFDVTNIIGTAYDASNTLVSGQTMRIANTSGVSGISANLLFIATGAGGGNGLGSISGVNTGTGSLALTFGTRNSGGSVTERMRISSTGAITTPDQPAWSVGLSSAQTISSPSIIAWNQSSGNDCFIQGGVTLNGDNGRVTVPVAGKYMLFASIRTEDPGAVTNTNLNIRRNGTNILRHYVGGAVNSAGSYMYIETRPVIVNCAANDYIDFNFDSVPDTFVISATANTVVRFGGFLMG
jgi:hypothetical protein